MEPVGLLNRFVETFERARNSKRAERLLVHDSASG